MFKTRSGSRIKGRKPNKQDQKQDVIKRGNNRSRSKSIESRNERLLNHQKEILTQMRTNDKEDEEYEIVPIGSEYFIDSDDEPNATQPQPLQNDILENEPFIN